MSQVEQEKNKSTGDRPVGNAFVPQKSRSPIPRGPAFPEGGVNAWSTVIGAMAVQFCTFGYTTSFGVYQDFYQRDYLSNESASTISWIGSINAFVLISSGILVGRIYDRGYFYYLMYGGSLILAFSLFMLSLTKPGQYYQIMLSQGVGVGIGAGMLYVPSIAVVSQYFQKRRSLAMTIVASGSSLGAVTNPIMLNNLLNDPSIGFATAARANAGLVSGLLLMSCMLMRTRMDPPESGSLWAAARRFVKDGQYVFAALGMSLFIIGFYFPLFYLQLDAVKHGLNDEFSFYVLVMLNGCSFVGRLAPGFMANRVGVGRIIVTCTFICSILIACMVAVKTVAGFVVFAVLFGGFSGMYVTLLAPLVAVLTDDLSELGARMGVAFFFCGVGSLIGTPIDGALLGSDYQWWRPALFSAIVAFLGCGSLFVSTLLLWRKQSRVETRHVASDSA